MGQELSAFSPFLSSPWRDFNWTDTRKPLEDIKNYKPPGGAQNINVLVYGPVGAGKSSFINSVQSVLLGRMSHQALVDGIGGESFTMEFAGHHLKKDQDSYCPFVFYDMMGLEEEGGVLLEDVRLVLDGRVKDGYKFNPKAPLKETSKFYNNHPTTRDKVHVLVCVVPADNGETIVKETTLHKIQEIRKEASRRGIPQMVVLTKIDRLHPEIQDDLKLVYRLKSMKQKMEQFQADVGIPMSCIFPVKNYHKEVHLDTKVNSLLLSALETIINAGGDYIEMKRSKEQPANLQSRPSRSLEQTG